MVDAGNGTARRRLFIASLKSLASAQRKCSLTWMAISRTIIPIRLFSKIKRVALAAFASIKPMLGLLSTVMPTG